jgi:hypothetical protein
MHLHPPRFRVPLKRKFGRPLGLSIGTLKADPPIGKERSFLKFGHTHYAPCRVQEKQALARVSGCLRFVYIYFARKQPVCVPLVS